MSNLSRKIDDHERARRAFQRSANAKPTRRVKDLPEWFPLARLSFLLAQMTIGAVMMSNGNPIGLLIIFSAAFLVAINIDIMIEHKVRELELAKAKAPPDAR